MSAIIFDGKAEAARRKLLLKEKIQKIPHLHVFSLVFQEDQPSIIYSNLKKMDAAELGIEYEVVVIPIATPMSEIHAILQKAALNANIQGIITQKPEKQLIPIPVWWKEVVSVIPPEKDMDGLVQEKSGVLPATARAIVAIFDEAIKQTAFKPKGKIAVVVGRGEIVGRPVADMLEEKYGMQVYRFGRKEFAEQQERLKEADVIVSATGQQNLMTANMLKPGVIVIDAGSPKPEVDPVGLDEVVSFRSPVPGGVGPMTRICLLENLVDLLYNSEQR